MGAAVAGGRRVPRAGEEAGYRVGQAADSRNPQGPARAVRGAPSQRARVVARSEPWPLPLAINMVGLTLAYLAPGYGLKAIEVVFAERRRELVAVQRRCGVLHGTCR